MPTPGEFKYFEKLGVDGMQHAIHKPWSDPHCGLYLMELGAMMGLIPGKGRLLDLGCGTGWTSVLFAQKGYDVVGQDLVPEAIEAGRKLKVQHGLDNLDFVTADYESLAFENEFDVAIFFDCLHHSIDEAKALNSAYRALKPGGICITSEPGLGHARRSKQVMEQFGTTERDMHPAKIIRAGKKSGFKCLGIHPHAYDLYLTLYRKNHSSRLSKILALPGVSSLAAIFSILVRRHIAGIVVLQK
ncbi:MAG: class I SAM-dependent methyltransferase [Fibrobacteria bacterium]